MRLKILQNEASHLLILISGDDPRITHFNRNSQGKEKDGCLWWLCRTIILPLVIYSHAGEENNYN